ncbi:MAG: Mini-ribonuclease 3 [Saccharofermentanales bacterium]
MFTDLKNKDPRSIPNNVLAYIGDCVFELYSRLYIVNGSDEKMTEIHSRNISIVNAGAQAASARRILDQLTDEELQIFKRGRNSNTGTMSKNANAADYRVATGIEALLGFLFLAKKEERLKEILELLIKGDSSGR